MSYSLLAVGGVAKVKHVTTSGEVIVGEALEASGVVQFAYNDYSAVLPALRAHAPLSRTISRYSARSRSRSD